MERQDNDQPAAESAERTDDLCQRITDQMKATFGDDQPRIDHALAVLGYAEQMLATERDASALVVRAAAILHDIGIQEAQRKHGSSAGNYQEIEGPPMARQILADLDVAADAIDHVCAIVGSHHSAKDIDTPEFRIIWDADHLVNLAPGCMGMCPADLTETVYRHFRTDAGKRIAATTLGH